MSTANAQVSICPACEAGFHEDEQAAAVVRCACACHGAATVSTLSDGTFNQQLMALAQCGQFACFVGLSVLLYNVVRDCGRRGAESFRRHIEKMLQ